MLFLKRLGGDEYMEGRYKARGFTKGMEMAGKINKKALLYMMKESSLI